MSGIVCGLPLLVPCAYGDDWFQRGGQDGRNMVSTESCLPDSFSPGNKDPQGGDITESGWIWCYQGLDRALSTVSIADGRLYVADVAGRLHGLNADAGQCRWIHETGERVWGSTLVADGKVYLPTEKHFWVLAAGAEKKVLDKISLGAPAWASPVAADGVVYVTSTRYLWACR